MKTSADVVIALQNEGGLNGKRAILQQAWALGHRQFFEGVQLCYDSFKTFGVKKVPIIEDADDEISDYTWDEFKALCGQLVERKLTGHAARDALLAAASRCDVHTWNNFYRRILLKDLKCKTTDTIVNQELEALVKKGVEDAKKYIVPVFSCQLATDSAGHQKKMVGWKLLDNKLDGVRLLSVLDVKTGLVTQYTRNGIINDRFTHITAELAQLVPHLVSSVVLDGEVISENFQTLMTQINRKDSVDTSNTRLHLFDAIPLEDFLAGKSMIAQKHRHELLVSIVDLYSRMNDDVPSSLVKVVPKLQVNLSTPEGQKAFTEFNREAIEAGYEGVMIKDPDAPYECKRRTHWLKLKPWISVDLEVTDVEQGTADSKYSHTLGNLICKGYDNGRLINVSVGSGWTDEYRDELWAMRDSLRGLVAEIKADAITKGQDSDVYSLRFPTFMRFRGNEPGEKL